jgi:hypothetical protein
MGSPYDISLVGDCLVRIIVTPLVLLTLVVGVGFPLAPIAMVLILAVSLSGEAPERQRAGYSTSALFFSFVLPTLICAAVCVNSLFRGLMTFVDLGIYLGCMFLYQIGELFIVPVEKKESERPFPFNMF